MVFKEDNKVTVEFQTKREAKHFMDWMSNSGEQGFYTHMNMQDEEFSFGTSIPATNRSTNTIHYNQPEQLIQKIRGIRDSLRRRKDDYEKDDILDWCKRFESWVDKKGLPEEYEEKVKQEINDFRMTML